MKTNYVAYYRVSTREQGISGLGIKDQQFQVKKTIGECNIIQEFTEIESGKKKLRPLLSQAIKLCKNNGYTLVVSKLDRLGRVARQLLEIRDSITLFVCESPNMTTLEFMFRAGMAQDEAEKISQRTKAALAEKKRQGFKFGKPENLTIDACKKGGKASAAKDRERAKEYYQEVFNKIVGLKLKGLSLVKIAKIINEMGHRTPNKKMIRPMNIYRIYKLFTDDSLN